MTINSTQNEICAFVPGKEKPVVWVVPVKPKQQIMPRTASLSSLTSSKHYFYLYMRQHWPSKMKNLWSENHPRNFWLCHPDLPDEIWQEAIRLAMPILGVASAKPDIDLLLELTLGEGQFGPNRYQFGFTRRLYYRLKPLLNQRITHFMRRVHSKTAVQVSSLGWPIETRYVRFQWEILHQVLLLTGKPEIDFTYFWPYGKQFAFVLTHDVETADGQRGVSILADIEESLGLRSVFNFVPERYPLDLGLIADLRKRGFEIGVHGLKHDGTLFSSYACFEKQAKEINRYILESQADGFRAPYTHRNPEWMQLLEAKYDLSFFDTDPFEPMPGGVMSIWPFTIGNFLELPYTLTQDSTLFNVLHEVSPRIWLEKTAFLKKYNGMALMLVHPDYSSGGVARQCYEAFLREIKSHEEYWHALPKEVAAWWKERACETKYVDGNRVSMARAALTEDSISIEKSLTSKKT